MTKSPKHKITIFWYAVPNENKNRGGWMPVYLLNGKQHGSTYGGGYDKNRAEELASINAIQEAMRYVGDWDIDVKKKP